MPTEKPTQPLTSEPFILGDWLVEPALNRLSRIDIEHRIEPRTMDVLVYLMTQSERVVSRDELMDQIWNGIIVNENTVTRVISQLRKALDEPGRQYIETIPKRGYRMLVKSAPHATYKTGHKTHKRNKPYIAVFLFTAIAVISALFLVQKYTLFNDHPDLSTNSVQQNVPVLNRLTDLDEIAIDLTWESGAEVLPVISHDGNMLAYAANRDIDTYDVYVQKFQEGTPLNITNTPEADEAALAFSPDLTKILIQRITKDQHCDFIILSLADLKETKIKDCSGNYLLLADWSRQLDLIALSASDFNEPAYHLLFYDLKHRAIRPFDYPKSKPNDGSPRFSPNGYHLAHRRGPLPYSTLLVMTVNGKNQRAMVEIPENVSSFDWLPDSEHLIWCQKGTLDRMYIMNIYQGDAKAIYNDCLDSFVIDESGQHIIFEKRFRNSRITQVDTSTGKQKVLIDSSGNDMYPAVSPNGEQLIFVSDRNGYEQLWLEKQVTPKQTQQITSFDFESSLSFPHWHPDGERLIFLQETERETKLWELNIQTNVLRLLLSFNGKLGPGIYSPFSDEIILSHSESGTRHQLIFISPDNTVEYSDIRGNHPKVVDSQTVAFIGNEKGDLMTMDSGRQIELLLPSRFSYYNYATWVIDEQKVYSIPAGARGEIILEGLQIKSKIQPDVITQIKPGFMISHMTAHVTSDSLLITETNQNETDIAAIKLSRFLQQTGLCELTTDLTQSECMNTQN